MSRQASPRSSLRCRTPKLPHMTLILTNKELNERVGDVYWARLAAERTSAQETAAGEYSPARLG